MAVSTIRTTAEHLQVGDGILHADGETEVREIDRTGLPVIITNPGEPDQVTGYAWQHVEIRRLEKA